MKKVVYLAFTAAMLLAAVMAGTTGPAKADTDHKGPGLMGTLVRGRIASLRLTDQQKAELKGVLKAHRPTLQPLLKEYVSERRALRGLMGAEQIDEAAIRAQVAKTAAIGSELAVERARLTRGLRGILTPERVVQVRKMQEKRDAGVDRFLARIAVASE